MLITRLPIRLHSLNPEASCLPPPQSPTPAPPPPVFLICCVITAAEPVVPCAQEATALSTCSITRTPTPLLPMIGLLCSVKCVPAGWVLPCSPSGFLFASSADTAPALVTNSAAQHSMTQKYPLSLRPYLTEVLAMRVTPPARPTVTRCQTHTMVNDTRTRTHSRCSKPAVN